MSTEYCPFNGIIPQAEGNNPPFKAKAECPLGGSCWMASGLIFKKVARVEGTGNDRMAAVLDAKRKQNRITGRCFDRQRGARHN